MFSDATRCCQAFFFPPPFLGRWLEAEPWQAGVRAGCCWCEWTECHSGAQGAPQPAVTSSDSRSKLQNQNKPSLSENTRFNKLLQVWNLRLFMFAVKRWLQRSRGHKCVVFTSHKLNCFLYKHIALFLCSILWHQLETILLFFIITPQKVTDMCDAWL